MGSIVKVGENKYRLYVSNKFRADGKHNRGTKTVVATSERAAKKLLAEFEAEFQNKPPQINSKITFKEFIDIWKKRHLLTLSPNTQNGDLGVLNTRLLPWFGHMRLNKISANHISEFVKNLSTDGVRLDSLQGNISKGTIYGIYKVLRGILNKAVEWGFLLVSPCALLPKEEIPKKIYKKPEILQHDELSLFLTRLFSLKDNMTNTKHQLFFYLSLMDGGRLGEHIALTWRDIDLASKSILINKSVYTENRETKAKSPKTTSSNRKLYIDDKLVELFKKHKAYQDEWLEQNGVVNDGQYVFLKTRRDRAEMPSRSMFWHWLNNFLKRNGLKHIGVHGFRRMAASYALSLNVPLTAVQEMLGHTDISTTNIYLRGLQTTRREGTEAMSNAFSNLIKE